MPFLDEIAAKLVADGVGVIGSTIFLGSNAKLPAADDAKSAAGFLTLIETGGFAPTRTQDQASAATLRPTAQVMAHANSYKTARGLCRLAYLSLDGIYNTALSGVTYVRMVAQQEPTDAGLDAASRTAIVFNVEAEKAPS